MATPEVVGKHIRNDPENSGKIVANVREKSKFLFFVYNRDTLERHQQWETLDRLKHNINLI